MFSKSIYSYALVIAGFAFIVIGIVSIYYSNMSVSVSIDGIIKPNSSDTLSPNMESGNTALISASGSTFNMSIIYPNKTIVVLSKSSTLYSLNLTANESGKYIVIINNFGKSDVLLDGYAYTKANNIAIIGQTMLIITGIIILMLGIRTRHYN